MIEWVVAKDTWKPTYKFNYLLDYGIFWQHESFTWTMPSSILVCWIGLNITTLLAYYPYRKYIGFAMYCTSKKTLPSHCGTLWWSSLFWHNRSTICYFCLETLIGIILLKRRDWRRPFRKVKNQNYGCSVSK